MSSFVFYRRKKETFWWFLSPNPLMQSWSYTCTALWVASPLQLCMLKEWGMGRRTEVQQSMWRKHLCNTCQVLSCTVSSKWAPALCRMLVLSCPPRFSFHESVLRVWLKLSEVFSITPAPSYCHNSYLGSTTPYFPIFAVSVFLSPSFSLAHS